MNSFGLSFFVKRSFSVLVFILVFCGTVYADNCSSYFVGIDNIRGGLNEDISILVVSSDRLFSACDDLEFSLDRLNNDVSLKNVVYELQTFIKRKDGVLSDMDVIKDELDDYDYDLLRVRSKVSASCYNMFIEYDDELGDISKDYLDVRRVWDKFADDLVIIEQFADNPDDYDVGDAKSVVSSLLNDIEKFYEEIEDMSGTGSIISADEMFSEAECIAMADVTLSKEKKVLEVECLKRIESLNRSCDVCVCNESLYDEKLQIEKDNLLECRADLKGIESKYESVSVLVGRCDINTEMVEEYKIKNKQLDDENTNLRGLVSGLNNTLIKCNSVTCEVCGPWFWVSLLLFLIMVIGWIVAM